ncbi:MAG: C39 family peptidase [Stenomitos frigidus ULC029]
MTSTRSPSTNTKTRSATRRIESFRQRFGEGHFYLACHAALPLALTPDLLYSLWANFQRDIHGGAIDIPWIAVADLMLSNLCKEVGNELYEMDQAVRDNLLNQLQNDSRFGLEHLRELADFVMAYVEQQLDSPDLDVWDLATGQKWRALAYKHPSEAAHSIATVLAQLPLNDKAEWIRMAALLNSLTEPLAAFQPLLNYIQAMADLTRGNLAAATAQMAQAVDINREVRVEGVNLPIPEVLNGTLPKSNEPDALPTSPPNRLKMPIAIAGGTIASVLILIGIQYGLQSPDSRRTPDVASSATPSSQSSPSASPTFGSSMARKRLKTREQPATNAPSVPRVSPSIPSNTPSSSPPNLKQSLPANVELPVPYLSQRDNVYMNFRASQSTSLAMALSYYGVKPKTPGVQLEDELYQKYQEFGDIVDWKATEAVAKAYGFKAVTGINRTLEQVKQQLASGHPVLAALTTTSSGSVVCFIGYTESGLIANDPWGNPLTGYTNTAGSRVLLTNEFLNRVFFLESPSSGWAMFITPINSTDSQSSSLRE